MNEITIPKLTLRPTTTYDLTEADKAFCFELSKVGYVHLLSNQVVLMSDKDGVSFKTYSPDDEKCCEGLSLPSNWVVESIYARDDKIQVTFGVNK